MRRTGRVTQAEAGQVGRTATDIVIRDGAQVPDSKNAPVVETAALRKADVVCRTSTKLIVPRGWDRLPQVTPSSTRISRSSSMSRTPAIGSQATVETRLSRPQTNRVPTQRRR